MSDDLKADIRRIVEKAHASGVEQGRLETKVNQQETIVVVAVCALALGFMIGYMV